jgi:hypothetical protein
LNHLVPFQIHRMEGKFVVGFRYLLCDRFRDGWFFRHIPKRSVAW